MSETDQLTIHVDPESDGTAEIIAEVTSRGFAGHSRAWVNLQDIRAFASGLRAYPLRSDTPSSLAGGYPSPGRSPDLEEAHVSIDVYPVGGKGQVGIRVRLKTPSQRVFRQGELQSVETELLTTYNRLDDFAAGLLVAIDRGSSATIESEMLG